MGCSERRVLSLIAPLAMALTACRTDNTNGKPNDTSAMSVVVPSATAPIIEPSFATPEPAIRRPAELTESALKFNLEVRKGLRQTWPTTWVVDRTLAKRLVEDDADWRNDLRFVPAHDGGKASGFKVFGIRAGDAASLLGFENGDLIESINGQRIAHESPTVETYSPWRWDGGNPAVTVVLLRQGIHRTHTYNVK